MDLNYFGIWLAVNIFSLLALSAYSMMEMACISFDRIRLQYFLTTGNIKMVRLNELLSHSGKLFGTTLICGNIALIVGSESARQIFSNLGVSPDWAILPQIVVVILFGELAPMFAARRYPEHVVRIGINFIYYSSKLLAPILWIINLITTAINRLFGAKKGAHEIFLARDELQKIIEVHEEPTPVETQELSQTLSNIFSISSKKASTIMRPLSAIRLLPSKCIAGELRKIARHNSQVSFPIVQEKTRDIVGIVYLRDLLRIPDNRRVRDYAKQPWFIQHDAKLLDVLKQFRINGENLSFVVDNRGKTVGYLTLSHIIETIFAFESKKEVLSMGIIDRTIDPDISVGELERELGIELNVPREVNFADYCKERLEGHPHVGDSFSVGVYEVKILEASVFEVRRVKVKTLLF